MKLDKAIAFHGSAEAMKDGMPRALAPPAERRLGFIDALRAIAILLVFIRHSTEVFAPLGHGARALLLLGETLNFGGTGVVIFFAISGFLIPSTLHGDRRSGTVRYVINRVMRLYPAFIVSVLPSVWSHYWLGGLSFRMADVWLNFTMLPRLFGARLANGAYWTLEVEILFYLVCLFLFAGGLLREAFSFAAVTFGSFFLFLTSQYEFFGGRFNPALTGLSFFYNLDLAVMCWGAVFRFWWDGSRLNAATWTIFLGFAAYWLLWQPLSFCLAAAQHHAQGYDSNLICEYCLGLGVFLVVTLHGRLRNPALLWVGRISYSFYLLHGVVIHVLQHEIEANALLRHCWNGYYIGAALLLTLAISHLSFRYIEQPCIRAGRRLNEGLAPVFAMRADRGAGWSGLREKLADVASFYKKLGRSVKDEDPGSQRKRPGSLAEIRQLTGLRGYAALNVACMHYGLTATAIFKPFIFGNAAVDLFFCLSSFTLCLAYGAGTGARLQAVRYAAARFARIYPLYIITMLFVLWCGVAWQIQGFPPTYNRSLVLPLVRQTLLLGEIPLPHFGAMGSWDTPAWSVSVEAFCYACIFPVLFACSVAARRLRPSTMILWMLVLGGLCYAVYIKYFTAAVHDVFFPQPSGGIAVWVPLIRGVTMFGAGWFAYLLYSSHKAEAAFIGSLTDALALVFLSLVAGETFGVVSLSTVIIVAPFLILGLMENGSVTARVLSSPPLHFLGKISYSLYLWHLPLRTVAMRLWPWHSDLHLFHAVLFPMTLAVLVATASYYCVEVPARTAIKRAVARWASRRPQDVHTNAEPNAPSPLA